MDDHNLVKNTLDQIPQANSNAKRIVRQPCIKKYQYTRLPNEVNHTSTNPTKL